MPPANDTTEIRDPVKGALAVDAVTVSPDIRILLATIVGQRDEHIAFSDLAQLLGVTTNTTKAAQNELDIASIDNFFTLATMDW